MGEQARMGFYRRWVGYRCHKGGEFWMAHKHDVAHTQKCRIRSKHRWRSGKTNIDAIQQRILIGGMGGPLVTTGLNSVNSTT